MLRLHRAATFEASLLSLRRTGLSHQEWSAPFVKVIPRQNRSHVSRGGRKIDAILESLSRHRTAIPLLKRHANPAINSTLAGIIFSKAKRNRVILAVPALDRLPQIPRSNL